MSNIAQIWLDCHLHNKKIINIYWFDIPDYVIEYIKRNWIKIKYKSNVYCTKEYYYQDLAKKQRNNSYFKIVY